MTHTPHPRRHRRGLITTAAGLAAGGLLALGLPLAASAHVVVSPDSAPSGQTSPLTFTFHHGCDDSPTTALQISIPDGVGNVTPVVEGGWTITRTLGEDKVPTEVTFTADHPIESGLSASVSMEVLLDSSAAGTTLTFPVVQKCASGQTAWDQVASDGQDRDDLDHPAPAVTVGDADTAAAGEDASTPAAAQPGPDATARWMAGGGLVLGAAAVVISLIGRRRARR